MKPNCIYEFLASVKFNCFFLSFDLRNNQKIFAYFNKIMLIIVWNQFEIKLNSKK